VEKKNEYIKKMQTNLTLYDAKLDVLKAKAAVIHADMKVEFLSQVESLQNNRNDFAAKYGKLKDSSEHAWGDVKAGSEKAWHGLEDSLEKALSRFGK